MSEQMRFTITMQGIADLAQVKRPAVSQWRTRYPESSSTPFPAPLDESGQPVFDALEVAHWLSETDHGNNSEAVEDAPYFSELFRDAMEDPKVWAALLAHARIGEDVTADKIREQLFLDAFVPSDVFNGNLDTAADKANQLAEAAYSASNVLDRLVQDEHTKESFIRPAEDLIAALLSEAINANAQGEVVSWGPGADNMVALATARHSVSHTIYLSEPGKAAYCAAAHGHVVEGETDEFTPSAFIYAQWISATKHDAHEFFEQLEDQLLGLDHTGVALVVAPAELLIQSQDAEVNLLRKNMLFGSGENFDTQLRYSALLPHGWSRQLGRRQLALWALRRPQPGIKSQGAIVLADHTGLDLDSHEPRKLISDVLAALTPEVPTQLHPYLRAKVVPEKLVRRSNTLRPRLTPEETDIRASSIVDLRKQAANVGIAEFNFVQHGNPYERHERKLIPWDIASTGVDKLVRVLKGSKLDAVNTKNPDGTITVLGADELLGLAKPGERRVELFELTLKLKDFNLTEPGDVVVLTAPRVKAIVDSEGGSVVEAPAQVIRCKQTRGRSKKLLQEVAVPELLADEINRVANKDKQLWQVPVLPTAEAQAFTAASREIAVLKSKLEQQLQDLDTFQSNLGEALLAGTIRGAPG
ncbi:DNA-binding protein [Corynebacterium hindlerae]|uniref:DNA-binding protein n=1 Tax=Corynebacterium hindlerae TaxID=699041 RepID=UPI0031B72B46